MTRGDIIRMAREAGLFVPQAGIPENGALTRFAALVAAAEREATFRDANIAASRTILDAAVLEEREACAKVCDLMEQQAEGTDCCKWPTPTDCAAAIRSRK